MKVTVNNPIPGMACLEIVVNPEESGMHTIIAKYESASLSNRTGICSLVLSVAEARTLFAHLGIALQDSEGLPSDEQQKRFWG